MSPLLHAAGGSAPARGFPPNQVIPATIVAILITAAVAWISVRYRQRRTPRLDRLVAYAEERSGLPGWASIPAAIVGVSLIVAVFGFYWDVAWHIDKGRDQGPFSTPAHYPIIIGLVGLAIAGTFAVVLDRNVDGRAPLRLPFNLRCSVGGALTLLCGLTALAGFPLDDVWHTLFGQDVTLWGPTHIQMIGGASLTTLAAWILVEEGRRRAPEGALERARGVPMLMTKYASLLLAGAFLIGMSTLQGEFDYGVPQFRPVYHPILIMLAAGVALVTARIRVGRGGAIGAALFFIGLRGALALSIGLGLSRTTPHFPLYLAEAVLVELAVVIVPITRQVVFGLVSGALIGTVGLAAEWGWSHVWMPLPWNAPMWPEAAILAFFAAVAGGVLGGLAGRALLPPESARQPSPRLLVPAAWVAAFAVIALALPIGAHTNYRATVTLTQADTSPIRTAFVTAKLDPAQAAQHAEWFNVTAWQGGNGVFHGSIVGQLIVPMRKISSDTFRSTQPVPVSGKWKTLLRLATVGSLQAIPIYLPADPAIPAKEVPASPHFTRTFVPDKKILQREAVGGSVNLQRGAYAALGLLGLAWIGLLAFGLRRIDRDAVAPEPPVGRMRPRRQVRTA